MTTAKRIKIITTTLFAFFLLFLFFRDSPDKVREISSPDGLKIITVKTYLNGATASNVMKVYISETGFQGSLLKESEVLKVSRNDFLEVSWIDDRNVKIETDGEIWKYTNFFRIKSEILTDPKYEVGGANIVDIRFHLFEK